MTTKELMMLFFDACDVFKLDFTMFNVALHECSLELYTAQEHDEWSYHGDLGAEIKSESELTEYLRSVIRQNIYYKSKSKGC
jgi:hypothetical protein